MSDSEEDSTSISKQKSIFSGMARVKQINHLREKWSPRIKSPLSDRHFVDPPPSSPRSRRSNDKYPLEPPGEIKRPTTRRTQSASSSQSRQSIVSMVDMDRYLAINTWLEKNDINVAQVNTAESYLRSSPRDYGLFDDMYNSLDVLENSLKTELSHIDISNDRSTEDIVTAKCLKKPDQRPQSPALFDYLSVISVDMTDVAIRNFWNQRDNTFQATVAFALPPESQFNAESLETFCFPTGIKVTSVDKRDAIPNENLSSVSKEGDFFVLMLSGGGVQGQSVQYAMCMKGAVEIPGSGDDGKILVLPICYCIIVQIPFISFFRDVLQGILDNLRDELASETSSGSKSLSGIVTDKHAGYIDDILQSLTKFSLPDKGLSVGVDVFPPPRPELILARSLKENDMDEKVALLLQWALPSLLSRLSIDRVLRILSLLLLEVKLVVASDEIALLSSATLGLASLLHPLTWAGPLISVLPPSMHEYMEAPVPLICGVDELPRNFECSKGACILYLTGNRVQLHAEDERAFGRLQMPGVENLSSDLERFTKQMLGRVTGSFRDNVTPLSTHLVIHRVRRHIEHLISVCPHAGGQYRDEDTDYRLDAREKRFVDAFMKTQMYQKYQDDHPITTSMEQSNQQVSSLQPEKNEAPTKSSSVNMQHDELKEATMVLFQIALAGVSTLPRNTSRVNAMGNSVADEEIKTDEAISPIIGEPELTPAKLSSPAISPTARIFSNLNHSPTNKVESPSREYQLLSPTRSESSTHSERRPDRTFVWPLSQSELDVFWTSDEASVASPRSDQYLLLHSPMFESPHRSPNNKSEASSVDNPKSVGRNEHGGIVNAPRGDTETTISIFDTALNEALGNADTADEAWLFETSDIPSPNAQHAGSSDDDRSTKHESLLDDDDVPVRDESPTKETVFEYNNSSPQHVWQQVMDKEDDGTSESHIAHSTTLAPEQIKPLMAGISIDSRGAWEGWCEGKMFVSRDFATITWERRAVAFTALNMNIAEITRIAFEDRRTGSFSGPKQRRVQLNFSNEAIYFQFSRSPQHDEFFDALKQLIQPTPIHSTERQRSFPSLSSPPPHNPSPVGHDEHRYSLSGHHDGGKPIIVTPMPSFQSHLESDLDLFKRKLQRGFLVEKHGRLGKPHAKLIFTDTLCSHIMWKKPPPPGTEDQQKVVDGDDEIPHRSSLFSQSKSIPVESITAIVTGKQTTVFRRVASNKSNDRVCMSILSPTRTLDICAYSLQVFQELYRGFSLLLEETKRTRDGLN